MTDSIETIINSDATPETMTANLQGFKKPELQKAHLALIGPCASRWTKDELIASLLPETFTPEMSAEVEELGEPAPAVKEKDEATLAAEKKLADSEANFRDLKERSDLERQIKTLTGKAPRKGTKLETLRKRVAELTTPEPESATPILDSILIPTPEGVNVVAAEAELEKVAADALPHADRAADQGNPDTATAAGEIDPVHLRAEEIATAAETTPEADGAARAARAAGNGVPAAVLAKMKEEPPTPKAKKAKTPAAPRTRAIKWPPMAVTHDERVIELRPFPETDYTMEEIRALHLEITGCPTTSQVHKNIEMGIRKWNAGSFKGKGGRRTSKFVTIKLDRETLEREIGTADLTADDIMDALKFAKKAAEQTGEIYPAPFLTLKA